VSRGLVLARVGRRSLHRLWLDRARPRKWDLRLVPFQELEPQDDVDCVVGDVIPGPKWTGLRELLNSWDGWREYDHVWMPDDDIYTEQDTITRLFEAGETLGFDLFAPALHEMSYFAHFSTMANRRFFARAVGFVEIMAPAFTRDALERLLPTLDETPTGWGWGLDSLWPKLLGHDRCGIIDGTPVLHTRPVGEMRDADLGRRVRAESDAIFAKYDCQQVHTTFGGYGPDLAPLELEPERLCAELVDGWRYLIERDPRLLSWIVEYQRPSGGWPAYPVAGTPSGPAPLVKQPV
jgi:hypothetical protein